MNKILEMKNITKRFPGVLALDNVSFEAYTGEILALCGENGAGKSTLMKVLSGSYVEGEYEGEIFVNGELQRFKNTSQSEKAGIAMIYQEISMHLDMTVAENLFLGRWQRKTSKNKFVSKITSSIVDWKQVNEECKKYLDMVELDVSPQTMLRSLSTSQQQLVSIARALSKSPKILVLDEPTSPLTSIESENLFKILHNLKRGGIASILISHKLDEVFLNADRVTVLRDGKTVSSYNKEETNESKVVADMVGREITSYYPKEVVEIGDVVMNVENLVVPHPYIQGKNIVEDVSFAVRKGEILGVAGLVGAGRSEIMNAIFAKQTLTSGDVYIEGEKVVIKNPQDAIKLGIGLVTEERKTDGIIGMLSIKDNSTIASLKQFSKMGILNLKKERDASMEYFDKMKVKAPSLSTQVQQLSGGNQQKIVLGKWLMTKPKIMIFDEPTRGIDVGAKYEIYKIMVDLAKNGIGVVMISSELPELMSMSDRVIVIANAKVQGELMKEEFTQEKIMEYATGIK